MKILCYGDSNTWGYIPNIWGYSKDAKMQSYDPKDCWWNALQKDHEVIVDGLCGRCIANDNKWVKDSNATYTICNDLKKYSNLDLIILQLGTNDCKAVFNKNAIEIAESLDNLINIIHSQILADIIVISPAQINENTPITSKYYTGAKEKSIQLDYYIKNLSAKHGFGYISGLDLEIGVDGEHLTPQGHQSLGKKVSNFVQELNFNM